MSAGTPATRAHCSASLFGEVDVVSMRGGVGHGTAAMRRLRSHGKAVCITVVVAAMVGSLVGSPPALADPPSAGPSNPAAKSVPVGAVKPKPVQPSRTDGPGLTRVDNSRFANAFGADYGNRLRLVGLPACVLPAPTEPSCQTQSDLGSVNAGGAVSAEVGLAGDVVGDADPADAGAAGTVVAVTSSSSSDGATWTATSLSPTYSWTAGGQG